MASSQTGSSRLRLGLLTLAALALVLVLAAAWIGDRQVFVGPARLADGSLLELRQVQFTTAYKYEHWSTNRLLQWLAPRLPEVVRQRLPLTRGSLGMGGDGQPHLCFTTLLQKGGTLRSTPDTTRVVVLDDAGNAFDAAWGGGTLGLAGITAVSRVVPIFPRRTDHVRVRILGQRPPPAGIEDRWQQIAEFRIRNPARGNYPQWTAEPLPATRVDGGLAVTLETFRSGEHFVLRGLRGGPATAARKTVLGLRTEYQGLPTTDWQIQTVAITDATGNRWRPYLTLGDTDRLWWTRDGRVELFGALWPGENAWKLRFEWVRRDHLPTNETWESTALTVPDARSTQNLDQRATLGPNTVELIHLGGRDATFPGTWQWSAKWWDESVQSVVALAVRVHPWAEGVRLVPVSVVDQDQHELRILEHRSQDGPDQVLFIGTAPDTRSFRVSLSVQRSRFVEFLARPTFVTDEEAAKSGDAR